MVALVILGALYVAGYYLALIVTVVASQGGGGRDYSLLQAFGMLALCAATVVAGVLLAMTRRSLRAPPSVLPRVVGVWFVWALVAALGPALVASLHAAGFGARAYQAPMLFMVVTTAACAFATRR
jgi:hypothetical protein